MTECVEDSRLGSRPYTKLQDDATNIKTEHNSIKTLTGTKTTTTVGFITILNR
eukprot:Pgem_evm1s11835